VAPRPLRVERLDGPFSVRHRAHRTTISIRASIPASLRIGGRRHRVGPRARNVRVRLPARPAAGLLHIRYVLVAGGRRLRGSIAIVRA
jgi:hypothetical protein